MKKIIILSVLMLMLGCSNFTDDQVKTNNRNEVQGEQGKTDTVVSELDKLLSGIREAKFNPEFAFDQDFKKKLKQKKYNSEELLESLVKNYFLPNVKAMHSSVSDLVDLTKNSCSKLVNVEQTEINFQSIKEQWKKSMYYYHRLEPFTIGPMKELSYSIPTAIYSRDTTWLCGIDIEVMRIGQVSDPYLRNNSAIKGLDAIEYLLYSELKPFCPPGNRHENDFKKWNAKPRLERLKDRCNYIHVLSKSLKGELLKLSQKWTQNSYEKIAEFNKAGETKTLQAIYDEVMSFIDVQLKDNKLGIPSGINRDGCIEDSCPIMAEHRLSKFGKAALKANYEGLISILLGVANADQVEEGTGLYHLLLEKGHVDLANNFLDNVEDAYIKVSKDYEGQDIVDLAKKVNRTSCLLTKKEQRSDTLCALYWDSKAISDLLKVDFRLALSLKHAENLEGDSD